MDSFWSELSLAFFCRTHPYLCDQLQDGWWLALIDLDWALFFVWAPDETREPSLVAQMVKHLPAVWRTQVQFLGREDPLEKEMATHSSILAWRVPRTEEPGGLHSPWGCKESDTTDRLQPRQLDFALCGLLASGKLAWTCSCGITGI